MVRPLPLPLLVALGDRAGRLAARLAPAKAAILGDNLRRVDPSLSGARLDRMVAAGFGSYGRYWAETLRLPSLSAEAIDNGFEVDGYHHLQGVREAGYGPIMVLPHLGGWEWAAAWLGRVAEIPVSAVVERLESDEVFEWFVELRSSYGISVLPLGDRVFSDLVVAVKQKHVVCLLGDRDLSGTGTVVDFLGHPTRLPIGPAILSRRTGAPLVPTAVFFDGAKRRCVVGRPIWPDRQRPLREAALLAMDQVAAELETFIRSAPDQWHVLEPLPVVTTTDS